MTGYFSNASVLWVDLKPYFLEGVVDSDQGDLDVDPSQLTYCPNSYTCYGNLTIGNVSAFGQTALKFDGFNFVGSYQSTNTSLVFCVNDTV